MANRKVNVFPNWVHYLLSTFFLHTCLHPMNGVNSNKFHNMDNIANINDYNQLAKTLTFIYDSASVDGHLQVDLVKSAVVSLQAMEKGNSFKPLFIDLSSIASESKLEAMQLCVKKLISNEIKVIVSLLGGQELTEFAGVYNSFQSLESETSRLFIYTPRSYSSLWKSPQSVIIKSLQMSEEARAVALLHRVGKVGVRTLIPVLDGDSDAELEQLQSYYKIGSEKKLKIKFTKPILLNNVAHGDHLKMMLEEHAGFNENRLRMHNKVITEGSHKKTKLNPGILLLARNASTLAMKIAAEKRHLLLNWFSPNILEFEEWAYRETTQGESNNSGVGSQEVKAESEDPNNSFAGTKPKNSFFGLYTVNFVGSKGWDNPARRQMLRDLAASSCKQFSL